ncbi:hypothetical protein Tco_1457113 [Tanacetum coccineum]
MLLRLLERAGLLTCLAGAPAVFDGSIGRIYLMLCSRLCLYMHDPRSLISLLSSDLARVRFVGYYALGDYSYLRPPTSSFGAYSDADWAGVPPTRRLPPYADIFTKGLPTVLFDEFRSKLAVVRSLPLKCGGMSIADMFVWPRPVLMI